MAKTKSTLSIMERAPSTLCEKGFEFNLVLPPKEEGGEPEKTDIFITVIGPESPKVKAHQRAKINEQLRLEAKGNAPATTVEALEKQAIESAIAATVSWRGVTNTDGESVPFNEGDALVLYGEGYFRSQVLKQSGELGNFTPG